MDKSVEVDEDKLAKDEDLNQLMFNIFLEEQERRYSFLEEEMSRREEEESGRSALVTEFTNRDMMQRVDNGGQLRLWKFLADILVEPCFSNSIKWTGNGLEFKILNPAVVFTEFHQMRLNGVPMTTMVDPHVRWRNSLLPDERVNRYKSLMLRTRRNGTTNIIASGEDSYYFDSHKQICERYRWNLQALLEHIGNATKND